MIPSFGNFMGLHGWFLHALVKGIIVGIRARIIVILGSGPFVSGFFTRVGGGGLMYAD